MSTYDYGQILYFEADVLCVRRLPSWMSLEELFDKLLFVAVSDDGECMENSAF